MIGQFAQVTVSLRASDWSEPEQDLESDRVGLTPKALIKLTGVLNCYVNFACVGLTVFTQGLLVMAFTYKLGQ